MAELLERYAGRTMVTPRSEWVAQIHGRIAQEAARTPSRRFVVALAALAPGEAAAAFRESVAAAFGQGRFPALVRVQAMALVLLVVLSVGVVGAGGAIMASTILRPPEVPEHTVPVVQPSPVPSERPTRGPVSPTLPADRPTPAVATPRPQVTPIAESTRVPLPTPQRRPTPRPEDTPGVQATPEPHPTPRPHPTQKPHPTPQPHPTQKPHPTPQPHPTQKPHPTPKPDRTPKPHPTPKAEKTPKPHPTPRGNRTRLEPVSVPSTRKYLASAETDGRFGASVVMTGQTDHRPMASGSGSARRGRRTGRQG
jgi:hypothetical protein